MKELTLTLKVITPLFMGGANMEPEIRSQSIKGVLRWWWRALKAQNDLKKLKVEEASIFGGSFNDEARCSSFRLAVIDKKENKGKDLRKDYNLSWNFDRNNRCLSGKDRGIGYVFYSVLNKSYIKPESTFRIKIQAKDEYTLKNVLASLWCAVWLGGVGARARRGAGNLCVIKTEGDTFGIDFLSEESKEELEEWLKSNFNRCIELVGEAKDSCWKYSNLSDSRLILGNKKSDWKEALNEIGTIYHDFRKDNKSNIFETATFGLPVIHRNGKVLTNDEKIKRRASPIIFKVIQYQKNFYWSVLRLAGEFLPETKVLSFNNKTQKPEFSKIDDFWKLLKEKQNKEIILQMPGSLKNIKKI